MNIKLMRRIDKWVGIPVCFIFTLYRKLFSIRYSPHTLSKGSRNFLFIKLSEMGSTIISYPAFESLKKTYPNAKFFFLCFEKNKIAVELLNLFDNILTIRDDSFIVFIIDILRIRFHLRNMIFDSIFDMELFSRVSAVLSFIFRSTEKIGFYTYEMEGLYRGELLTKKVSYNPYFHIKNNLFALFVAFYSDDYSEGDNILKSKEYRLLDKFPKWKSTPEIRISLDKKISLVLKKGLTIKSIIEKKKVRAIVAINHGGGMLPIRAWPINLYIKLILRLIEKKILVILIGLDKDMNSAKQIMEEINSEYCIDMTGKTSIHELLELLNYSDLLVTNDGGPAHFATLTKTKQIVFFGPETPLLYKPIGKHVTVMYSKLHCSPCLSAYNNRTTSCKNNICLQKIKVNSVEKIIYKKIGL